MENKKKENELNELIHASMQLNDTTSPDLNKRLKVSLYQREALLRQTAPIRAVPLWFVPMILNVITFSLFAILALSVITNPFFARLAAGLCIYMGAAGILLTAVGVKRTDMKKDLTVHIQKRGVLA